MPYSIGISSHRLFVFPSQWYFLILILGVVLRGTKSSYYVMTALLSDALENLSEYVSVTVISQAVIPRNLRHRQRIERRPRVFSVWYSQYLIKARTEQICKGHSSLSMTMVVCYRGACRDPDTVKDQGESNKSNAKRSQPLAAKQKVFPRASLGLDLLEGIAWPRQASREA